MNLSLKSKIINITSYNHRWVPYIDHLNQINPEEKESYSMYLAYSYSKLLVIAFSFYLSNYILSRSNKSPKIVNIHPGKFL